jgi:cytochrome c biogenesis protein CcmG/thiol:disulfide interchange protein DsbE
MFRRIAMGIASSGGKGTMRQRPARTTLAIGLISACLALPIRLPAANLRKAAPNFTLIDSKGASVRLSDYKGKVVLLSFWATWCLWCETEIPWYMEFQDKYKDKGLSLIGVSMDADGWRSVRPFLQEKKMTYTIVVGNEALASSYALNALPLTVLIDRDGKIAGSQAGIVDKDSFENEIRVLLRATPRAQQSNGN